MNAPVTFESPILRDAEKIIGPWLPTAKAMVLTYCGVSAVITLVVVVVAVIIFYRVFKGFK